MTWIKTVPLKGADEKLREALRGQRKLYPPEYGVPVPALQAVENQEDGAGIVNSHSLLPDTLYHAFATYGTLLSPELPLSRRQHEMIATLVSVLNECFY
ncbi:MAG TPA: hypothetical protein VFB38_16755 [Chthonomonadaceae bacterium]|nr:hypothetical protein [Chthonomonadaceae bacterium]